MFESHSQRCDFGKETVQLNIFDLPEFNYLESSKNHTERLPIWDRFSNSDGRIQGEVTGQVRMICQPLLGEDGIDAKYPVPVAITDF